MVQREIKRIVLYHSFILNPGGAERLLFEEYNFLKTKGISVKIICFKANPSAFFDYNVASDLEVLNYDGTFLSMIRPLRKKLLDLNPDLVISASGSLELYVATLLSSIPYVLHIHGSLFWFDDDLLKYGLIHKGVFNQIHNSIYGHKQFIKSKPCINFTAKIKLEFLSLLDYFAVRKSKHIIVLTPQVNWEVMKLYKRDSIIAKGCLDPHIFEFKSKIDIRKKYNLSADQKIVLSISRLDRRKRLDLLIDAFAASSKDHAKNLLMIGGIGPDENRLRLLAEQSGVNDRIIFLGLVKDDELFDYYFACDVFAFPGWTTSPITTYEALALNKKVIWSTEASEPLDILNDPHVFMASPDVNSFSKAISKALELTILTNTNLYNYRWQDYFETFYKAIETM